MPFVLLKPNWPGSFRRRAKLRVKGKDVMREFRFHHGIPVELSADEVDALRSDIGTALMPVEFDAKNRPRVITDAVDAGVLIVAESTD